MFFTDERSYDTFDLIKKIKYYDEDLIFETSKNLNALNFLSIGSLGRCFLLVDLSVRVFVCVCVCPCVHFLRYRLTVFLPPLPEVGCPILLEIRNPWGKVMERSGLIFEHFCLEVV